MKTIPICPLCGKKALLLRTLYGKRYYCCNLWAWGRFPLVDKETHDLRRLAHDKFDPIWKQGKMTRTKAYKKLAKKLGIRQKECHMKLMEKDTLNEVLELINDGELN